jgi:uncharacterized protein (TIGR02268 family)
MDASPCVRAHVSGLFFDAKLARVEVEGRERFRRVKVVDDTLVLVASKAMHDGDRVRVTAYFEEGAVPASATFVLVVHPSQAERQVEVSRHERTVASLRQGERQARAEARQCQEEKVRFQAECGGWSPSRQGSRGASWWSWTRRRAKPGAPPRSSCGRKRSAPGA